VCLDKHTTGDGLVSGLQVLTALRVRGETLAQATAAMTLLPQVLVNVRTAERFDFAADPRVRDAAAAVEQTLAGRGRLLLRASGTEPVIRVMVEGDDPAEVRALAEGLADVLRAAAPASGSDAGPGAAIKLS
jgi:phosphoglucosamine mutase